MRKTDSPYAVTMVEIVWYLPGQDPQTGVTYKARVMLEDIAEFHDLCKTHGGAARQDGPRVGPRATEWRGKRSSVGHLDRVLTVQLLSDL